jgi:hypothetical protein
VWEFASDEEGVEGQDETWVRPVDTGVVPKRSYMHVAAEFVTINKEKFTGFVTVSTLDGTPDVCQGVILHERDYLFVSNSEASRFDDSRQDLLKTLRLSERQVFPLSFKLKVPVAGHKKYTGGILP